MIGAPNAPKNLAAVDLPLAMPPVSPTRNGLLLMYLRSSSERGHPEVSGYQLGPEHEHEPSRGGEKGAECNRGGLVATAECDQRESDDGADGRRDQDDGQEHPPSEPGAQRREQLEVTIAHPFLASEQPEQMIDAPEAEVACHRANDAGSRVNRDRRGVARRGAPEAER